MPGGSGCGSELLLDLGGVVLRDVLSMAACIVLHILRQQRDDRNGVAALDALMILEEKG